MEKVRRFVSGVTSPSPQEESAWWFIFQDQRLLVQNDASSVRIPALLDVRELGLRPMRQHFLGRLDNRHCYTAEVSTESPIPQDMEFEGLRQVYGRLDEDLFWISARAIQIIDWDKTHQFCGRCGTRTRLLDTERARECPQCSLLHFPRLAPAIIVLIERGRELLLARSRRFVPGMYSVLAGFVEPGETLEEAVMREVREEVGISIGGIRYFGSQPWPFPHSLMIGFTATYEGGEISLDDKEIEDAAWFTPENLPPLPGKISIARKLIDAFLEKQGR